MLPPPSLMGHRIPTASGKPSKSSRKPAAPCSPSSATSLVSSPQGSGSKSGGAASG